MLSAKATADTGLSHTHHGFGNVQRVGNNATAVEHDLRGAHNVQASVGINGAIGTEGLHHVLLHSLHPIFAVDDDIAVRQNTVHIAIANSLGGTQIALVIGANGA